MVKKRKAGNFSHGLGQPSCFSQSVMGVSGPSAPALGKETFENVITSMDRERVPRSKWGKLWGRGGGGKGRILEMINKYRTCWGKAMLCMIR